MSDDKTLRLLLRAEFAEFKVQFFQELQVKLDAKADRLPFELLAKDVAELKAASAARRARENGIWYVLGSGKAFLGWLVAAGLAAADLFSRHH